MHTWPRYARCGLARHLPDDVQPLVRGADDPIPERGVDERLELTGPRQPRDMLGVLEAGPIFEGDAITSLEGHAVGR